MRLLTFLLENAYTKEINQAGALRFLKVHCKKNGNTTVNNMDAILYRRG